MNTPTIQISAYTRLERKQLLNVRFQQLSKRNMNAGEIVRKIAEEFGITVSSVYYYIDTRLGQQS